jgi:hypothetical protein
MAGDYESAVKHYRIAAGGTTSIPEQNYLMTQAARLDDTNARREEATAPFSQAHAVERSSRIASTKVCHP